MFFISLKEYVAIKIVAGKRAQTLYNNKTRFHV